MLNAILRLLFRRKTPQGLPKVKGFDPKMRRAELRARSALKGQQLRKPSTTGHNETALRKSTTESLKGKCYVIDGDTIVINKIKIRLAGIDAPELDHPWGKKSKFALVSLCKGQTVTATIKEEVSYDRIVAVCTLPDGTDIAAALVEQGLALDWPKFSGGKYSYLEPQGIRKKLWRAAAKQRGKYKPGS